MTNAIGSGTANVAVNMVAEEARIHGKVAFELNVSRGEFIREALQEWYARHRPDLAEKIETLRKHHREIGSALLLAIYIGALAFGGSDLLKKESRRPRICKGAQVKRIEEAIA